ncbi:MAG: DUF1028 domain-containing protein [Alphaproteobacteria bacterium]|nr:MAG: DUF1028 domain-containing protein [Alphaproteobacteria bacterium]
MRRTTTLALSVRCPTTGQMGLAFVSTDPPDTAFTCQVSPLAGQCLQIASPQTQLNRKTLALMAKDLTPEEALRGVLAEVSSPGQRQILALALDGQTAGHTGNEIKAAARHGWTGHLCQENMGVIGLGLPAKELAAECLDILSRPTAPATILSDRLVSTLNAIEDRFVAGSLPLTAAGIHILGEDPYPLLDLRVDMHDKPITRLAEVYEDYMAEDIREDALLPTSDHPHGIPPTGWGETKRFVIRKWREVQRQWKKRRGGRNLEQ